MASMKNNNKSTRIVSPSTVPFDFVNSLEMGATYPGVVASVSPAGLQSK